MMREDDANSSRSTGRSMESPAGDPADISADVSAARSTTAIEGGVDATADDSRADGQRASGDGSSLPPVRRPRASDQHVAPSHPVSFSAGVSFHASLFFVALGVFVASLLLDVNSNAVTTPGFNFPLPSVCSFKRTTGLDCPGCGLTRCFVSLSHGRLQEAMAFNPAGIVLYGLMLIQLPYRGYQIWRIRNGLGERSFGWLPTGITIAAAGLLIVQWAARLGGVLG